MRRLASLLCASFAVAGAVNAGAQEPSQALMPLVAEFRLAGRTVPAIAWRDAQGRVYAERETFEALRLKAPQGERAPLDGVSGLSYRHDDAETAVLITCTSACYTSQTIAMGATGVTPAQSDTGAFLNLDLVATHAESDSDAAGAFEFVVFGDHGAGEIDWTARSNGDAVRLETQWTFEHPEQRLRVRLGDSITRGGATGTPFRFGGVQIATDFSIEPGFIAYPTPTLNGEAAAPSTVDLYVDGALRLRRDVDAGPFSIVDAPVLSGAGVAQVVVTDALGRQHMYAQPFYASPAMLRPGLTDYSLALGAEREHFTRRSNDYGRAFVSGVYRRGLTNTVTAEARLEGAQDIVGAGVSASFATVRTGQIDVAVAGQGGTNEGMMARAAWTRTGRVVSFALDAQAASADFRRLGESRDRALPQLQASGQVGAALERFGAASFAATLEDSRDRPSVRTLAFSYAPPRIGAGNFDIQALYVDERGDAPFLTLAIGYSVTLRGDIDVSTRAQHRRRRLGASVSAQRAPEPEGGWGWSANVARGDRDRDRLVVEHIGATHRANVEVTNSDGDAGVRGQVATGVAWIGGTVAMAQPIHGSFALVELDTPEVGVLQDRRAAGRTDRNGRRLVTNLRPYESNRIGVALDEMPLDRPMPVDEIVVRPRPRSGVVVRFAAETRGASGEIRVVDGNGEPLPAGAMLTSGDIRFPVGTNGQAYVTNIDTPTRFVSGGCDVLVTPEHVRSQATLQCAGAL